MSTIQVIAIAGYGSSEQFREIEARLGTLDIQYYHTASEGFPITLVTSAPITSDPYEVFTALYDEDLHEEVVVAFSEGASHYDYNHAVLTYLGDSSYRLIAEYPGFDEEGDPLF